ncbi:MAG: hypothetical protein GEU78_19440 [Actinobacteria bacterium]|nr:hypothetical protein [Actinomycetota bacterium]
MTASPLIRYSIMMAAGQSALFAYLTAYSLDVLQLSPGTSGYPVAIIGGLSIPARIIVGALTQGATRRMLLLMASCAALSALILMTATADQRLLLWVGVVLFALSGAVWNSVAQLTVVQSTSSAGAASELSARLQSGFLAGLVVGPLLAAAVIDAFDYRLLWTVVAACFAAAAAQCRHRLVSTPAHV